MNDGNRLYRVLLNMCVSVAIGFFAVLLEYTMLEMTMIDVRILWYIIVSGFCIGLVFEFLFSTWLPLSGNHLKRNVIWRNRLISAVVNAVIVSVLGKLMLGAGTGLIVLILISVSVCVIAVLVVGVLSEIRYRHSIEEMNRRIKQLNSLSGYRDSADAE
ncbi:MAG: hypothetical protein IJC98_07860 [Clostridia bacterium]|nr:hypothetical protein [Clostridia bacterium]